MIYLFFFLFSLPIGFILGVVIGLLWLIIKPLIVAGISGIFRFVRFLVMDAG